MNITAFIISFKKDSIEDLYKSKLKQIKASKLVKTKNPYSGNLLYWGDTEKNDFCKNNKPNTFDWDYKVKEHIIENAKNLPKNYGIIDCGAHIGDGAIPIADALIKHGRNDIKIYAIDPSPKKCNYIENIAKINNLDNITVISCGLSDKDGETFTHAIDENWVPDKNTGGIRWHKISKNREKINFNKLDTLVSNGVIDSKIGYIHFDVEDMEPQAILGGIELFTKDQPILSCETHSDPEIATNNILKILSKLGYKFQETIQDNSI